MPTISWYSLKPFTFSPCQKITVSYGLSNEEVICVRADLRSYYNGFPTRNGVNLKRWEFIQLGRFLVDLNQEEQHQEEVADELTMTKLDTGDINLRKKHYKYTIEKEAITAIKEIIPGVFSMLEILKDPIGKHPSNLLHDIFIYSKMIGDRPGSINDVWNEEKEIIIDRNLQKVSTLTPSWEWDGYQIFFGKFPDLSAGRQDFIDKFAGSFIDALAGMLERDEGTIMRSLTLFSKKITK